MRGAFHGPSGMGSAMLSIAIEMLETIVSAYDAPADVVRRVRDIRAGRVVAIGSEERRPVEISTSA
jgi:hypothetical protein